MEQNLETEVRGAGEGILFPRFEKPGIVIQNAILAGNRLAYLTGGLLYPYGAWKPQVCRWATKAGRDKEEKSLIPCMTAIAIRYLELGGFYRRGKRVRAKKNAD